MKYSFIEDTDFVHRNHRRMWLIQQKAFKKAFKMPFFVYGRSHQQNMKTIDI